ncbi:MAG: hypothetical protein RBR43_00335 [Desulfuromonadaceae bacterium]|nr:hypothetical protein [Desulfuromonas sp.]MDY0184307.1 hypothetical protein [Desulfuromonadaceae bacterium]
MEALIEWLKPLKTSMLIRYISDLDLLHNSWFIAGAIFFIVICLLLKWRLLLSCTLTLTGLIALVYVVHSSGTDLEHSSDSLFIFIGGGTVLVFLFVYFVFMRGD